MKTHPKHTLARPAGLLSAALLALCVFSVQGCTDLDEEVFGSVTADNFYQTQDEVIAAMAPVYAQLRGSLDAYHNLSEVTTDEVVVPTRGQDWYDNGTWLQLQYQTWDPAHGTINTAYGSAYTGIARANVVLQTLADSDIPNKGPIEAELRALRAFYYYHLMDLFGGVPIVGDDEWTVDPKNLPARASRAEVFGFIEQELLAAREQLPVQYEESGYGRITKGACDALLANMYLNAEVFTGTVSASGLAKGQAHWQDAVTAADRVLNAGVYELESDWFANFSPDNHNSREAIFLVAHLSEPGLGVNFNFRSLHYSQLSGGPWNGFATLAQTFNTFSNDDLRKQIFLEGPQTSLETGEPVNDREGNPLVFTPEFPNGIEDAGEGHGVRIYKFPEADDHNGPDSGNDYMFFRLAEMYLIKAEALNELNGPNAQSIELLNRLRERVFPADKYVPLKASDFASREALRARILQERLFELTYEAKRRQDLIRHGKYTQAWEFKQQSEPFRVLFPLPQQQMDANPNLAQNPGY